MAKQKISITEIREKNKKAITTIASTVVETEVYEGRVVPKRDIVETGVKQ